MWQTERFCSSQVYICRVHGLVNDSASTSSTPSRSASPPSGSIRKAVELAASISGELRVGAPDVQGPDGLGPGPPSLMQLPDRKMADRAGQERMDGRPYPGARAERVVNEGLVGTGAVAHERHRTTVEPPEDGIRQLDGWRFQCRAPHVARGVDLSAPRVHPGGHAHRRVVVVPDDVGERVER